MALILAGHMRSGTTLLREVCQSHPRLEVTREFGNFHRLHLPLSGYARFILGQWWRKRGGIAPLPRVAQPSRRRERLGNLPYVARYLYHVARLQDGRVTAEVIDGALRALHPGAVQAGDKQPDYALRLEELSAEPVLRCVYIYRDPRDVAASTVEKTRGPWRQGHADELRDPGRIGARWAGMMAAMERCRDRLLVIRYEDFVTDPHPVLRRLGEWLGVDPSGFDPAGIHGRSIGNYRAGLTPQEIADVIAAAGPTMQRYGYPTS